MGVNGVWMQATVRMKGDVAVSANAVEASLGSAVQELITAAASASVIALTRPISQVCLYGAYELFVSLRPACSKLLAAQASKLQHQAQRHVASLLEERQYGLHQLCRF